MPIVDTYLGCCGTTVDKKLKPWEEPFDFEDTMLYKCEKCGKEDFAEAFEVMELQNDKLECSKCDEVTKHDLESFDWFSGIIEARCKNCNTLNSFNDD